MTISAATKPPPRIGQLKTGEYVVFNMEGTPLWHRIFEGPLGPNDAHMALMRHYINCGHSSEEAWALADRADGLRRSGC